MAENMFEISPDGKTLKVQEQVFPVVD